MAKINDWTVKRLDEVATVTMGQSPPSSSYNSHGAGVPFLQGTPPVVDSMGAAVPNQWTTEPTRVVDAGTALMTVRAPVGELFTTNDSVCLGRGLAGIKANDNVSQAYLNYYLQFSKSQLDTFSQGSTFTAINSGDLKGIRITLPSYQKQEYIGSLLNMIDQDIAKTDQIIQKTGLLKQGLMQQVLISGKSKPLALKDILDSIIDHRGLTPKKMGSDWLTSGIPALSAMNVKNGRIVNQHQIRFVDDTLYKKWMPKELQKGDILLTSEAPLGEAYIVKNNEKYCLSQRLFALRPNFSMIKSEYLFYFLISSYGRKVLMDRSSGSTAKGIRQTELVKIIIPVPNLLEQEKIGALFISIDKKIDHEKYKQAKLTLMKRGLIQDIFNQKVQVN